MEHTHTHRHTHILFNFISFRFISCFIHCLCVCVYNDEIIPSGSSTTTTTKILFTSRFNLISGDCLFVCLFWIELDVSSLLFSFRCCFVHLETKKISGTKWKIFFYFMQFILWFEFHFFFFIGVFRWILIIIIIHFGRAITRQDKCHDDDDWWWWQRRRQRPHLLFTPFFSSDVCYFYSIFVHFFFILRFI